MDAVRGRIRRGKLEAEHEGSTVYVFVGTKEADRPRPSPDESRLVEVLEDQNAYLREQLAAEREANRENRRIIIALTSRVPELEASREPPQPEREAAEETAQRPPWWRRILGG